MRRDVTSFLSSLTIFTQETKERSKKWQWGSIESAGHRGGGVRGGAADEQLVGAVIHVCGEGVELVAGEGIHAHDDVHVLPGDRRGIWRGKGGTDGEGELER